MKKNISLVVALLLVMCCLTACNFTSNMSGMVGGEMQATSKVKDMMTAMAEKRLDDAEALMHSSVASNSGDEITQMSDFLSGRKVTSMVQKGVNVKTSTGTGGKVRQENATFQVSLDDGSSIHLSVTYLSNNVGEGFVSFQIVLGVV